MRRARFHNSFLYNRVWLGCRDHFLAYRAWYVAIFLSALIGFGLGLGGATAYTHRVTIIEISDGYIMGIMNGTMNGGSLFWSRMLSTLGLFLLVLLFGLHRYMIPLHFLLVLYRGFLTGFKIMLLIGMYGITGFFNALIFVLPFETIFFVSVSFVMVCTIERCLVFGRRGIHRYDPDFARLLIRICPAAGVMIVFSIIEAILVPIMFGTF